MLIKKIELTDVLTTNAYFYIDEKSQSGFLIDPACEAEKLLQIIKDNNWHIEKMLITHGHFDHIGAVEQLHKTLNIPYFIHEKGADYLTDGMLNLSLMCNRQIILPEGNFLADGDEIKLKANPSVNLKVIYTPGHTQDGVVFYDEINKVAFVGDTIFKDSIGATHFPGGDLAQLQQSIKQRIFTLPDDVVLYSGHTDPTTVGQEKQNYRW